MEISKVSYSILLEARCYKCFVIFSPFLSPGSPPVKRITIRAFAGVAMLFHLLFFLFFLLFRHDTLVGKWHHQISPPSFDLSYTRERIGGENSQKGDYTRYPFDDLDCSPSCFSRNLQRYPCLRN